MSATVRRLHPEVVAHTVCPNGHKDTFEAINPVVVGGEFISGFWPSAFDFCMECEQPVVSAEIEVRR